MEKFLKCSFLFSLFLLLSGIKDPNAFDVQKISRQIEKEIPRLAEILKNNRLIERVTAQNRVLPRELRKINNANWKNYNGNSKVIKYLETGELASELKKELPFYVSEFFISDIKGNKVLFLEKTTKFNHYNMKKFQVPISGKIWKGEMERDDSSGIHQIQIGMPIRSGENIVGVAIFGLSIVRLEDLVD